MFLFQLLKNKDATEMKLCFDQKLHSCKNSRTEGFFFYHQSMWSNYIYIFRDLVSYFLHVLNMKLRCCFYEFFEILKKNKKQKTTTYVDTFAWSRI